MGGAGLEFRPQVRQGGVGGHRANASKTPTRLQQKTPLLQVSKGVFLTQTTFLYFGFGGFYGRFVGLVAQVGRAIGFLGAGGDFRHFVLLVAQVGRAVSLHSGADRR